MKLKVLVDNNTYIDEYYFGEPAVSYYVETEDKRILFDTGYSDIVVKNAELMNIDLSKLTHIVLSHGHNDHTRGLQFLLEKYDLKNTELICHPECFAPKYFEDEYIGAPYSETEISKLVKYKPSAEAVKITENLIFLGQIPRVNDFENKEPIGVQIMNEKAEPDFLSDDTAMFYKCDEGIFIITGCSHSGICNIVDYAIKICGDDRILGIIGGFHLFEDNEQLRKTVEKLEKYNIQRLYPCHCVSLIAKAMMMSKLPVIEVGVGLELEV